MEVKYFDKGVPFFFSLLINSKALFGAAMAQYLIEYRSAFLRLPGGSVVKNLPTNTDDAVLVLGSGRSPGGGSGNPFQYSCLEKSMDRGAWLGGL